MKKRFGKVLVLFLVLVMTVSLMSACNSTDKSADESSKIDGESSQAQTSDISKADEKISFSILSGTITEDVEGKLEQAMADDYMKLHPNVTINYIGTPANDLTKKMTAFIASDSVPEVFVIFQDFQPKALELGIIENLKPHLD